MTTHQDILAAAETVGHAATRRRWRIITSLLVIAVFAQAVFAGALLSGFGWGRAAHSTNAAVLTLAALAASITAAVTLRGVPGGRRLAGTLLALTLVLVAQAALGGLSAGGVNLLWLHVPLGVALVGFTAQTMALAGRLGGS